MDRKLSLQTFDSCNRTVAIAGIRNILQTICPRSFTDVLLCFFFDTPHVVLEGPLLILGFPQPLFGSVIINPQLKEYDICPTMWKYSRANNKGWTQSDISALELSVPEDMRTLFLTFLRGFPVSEDKVLGVFHKEYENYVEKIEIGNVSSIYEQHLYARLILRSFYDIEIILKGRQVLKYRVNGKHIWARRYEIRE